MRLTSRWATMARIVALGVPLGLAAAAGPAGAATSPNQWPQLGGSARHLLHPDVEITVAGSIRCVRDEPAI